MLSCCISSLHHVLAVSPSVLVHFSSLCINLYHNEILDLFSVCCEYWWSGTGLNHFALLDSVLCFCISSLHRVLAVFGPFMVDFVSICIKISSQGPFNVCYEVSVGQIGFELH